MTYVDDNKTEPSYTVCPNPDMSELCARTYTDIIGNVDWPRFTTCMESSCTKIATSQCPSAVDSENCFTRSKNQMFVIDWSLWSTCVTDECARVWSPDSKEVNEPVLDPTTTPVEFALPAVYPKSYMNCPNPFQPDSTIVNSIFCSSYDQSYCYMLGLTNAGTLGLDGMDCDAYYWCVNAVCYLGQGW